MALVALADSTLMPPLVEAPSASAFSAETEPSWHRSVIARMGELISLRENWDGYGGRPVNLDTAMFSVQMLIETLDRTGPCPQMVPLSYGGVQIEWHERGMDLEIEVIAPQEMIVSYEDAVTGEDDEFPLSNDVSRLASLLGDLAARSN